MPESPEQQPLQPPQYQQHPQINGQVPHKSRPRTKKSKIRSKSLQPESTIPWRKSSRPRRGRSLDKSPFLPGYKPAPVKSWTEETVTLKPAPIEKKIIPKLEAAKVVLKSIKSERDQGLLNIGYTLEKIIKGKTPKEAIPWIDMREKLRHVATVQKQLEKFELDEVYLHHIERPKISDQEVPQHAVQEQEIRDHEIQRLKKLETSEIMEMTEQIEKLIEEQQKKGDAIPWKEMRQHLKKVEHIHKEIEKFKVEEVELRHLVTEEIVTQETTTATEDTVVMKVDDTSKQSIQKLMRRNERQKYIDVEDIQKHRYITTEDINLLSVSERERLESQRRIKEEQALNWRQIRQPQQFVQIEDTQMLHRQEREDTLLRTRPQHYEEIQDKLVESVPQAQQSEDLKPLQWERGRKQHILKDQQEQKIKERTEETVMKEAKKITQRRIVSEPRPEEKMEQITLKPTPRQKPKPVAKMEKPHLKPLARTQQQIEEVDKALIRTYEEAVDVLEEDKSAKDSVSLQPVVWARGKKKSIQNLPEKIERSYEEATDVLPEETQPQPTKQPEPVLWKRGKKIRESVQEKEAGQISEVSGLEDQKLDEEIRKHEVKSRLVPEPIQKRMEEVKLKPTPRLTPEKKSKPEEVQLKPIKRIQPQKTEIVEETLQQTYKEATDILRNVSKPVEGLTPIDLEREMKIPYKLLDQTGQKPEEASQKETTEETTIRKLKSQAQPKEEKLDEVRLKPIPRSKPKEQPQPEEIQLKPVKRVYPSKTEAMQKAPQKKYEEAIDVLPDVNKFQEREELKPIAWERGKKKPQKLLEETSEKAQTAYEEEIDVSPEKTELHEPEQFKPKEWGRSSKTDRITDKEEEKAIEEIREEKKKAGLEPKEEKVEEVKLKHRPRLKPMEEPKGEEIQLKPVKRVQPSKAGEAQETPQRVHEEKIDILSEESKPLEAKELQPVPWARGKKKSPHDTVPKEIKQDKLIKAHEKIEDIPQRGSIEEEVKEITEKKPPKKPKSEFVLEAPEETVDETDSVSPAVRWKQIDEESEQTVHPRRTRKLLPQEPEKREQVVLKPIPKKPTQQKLQEDILEEPTLKPLRRPEEITEPEQIKESVIEEITEEITTKRTRRKKPKKSTDEEEEELTEKVQLLEATVKEEAVDLVTSKPEIVQKSFPEPQDEKPEDVKLKPFRKPIKELSQEETLEEVRLKPVKRVMSKPEEQKMEEVLLQHVEKPDQEIVVEEKDKIKKIKKPKHRDLPDIPDAERVNLETPQHLETEKEIKDELQQPQLPWKRGEKKKPAEKPVEEKEWPKGKRRPLPEEQPEEIKLKPVPPKRKDEAKKPEEIILAPKLKPKDEISEEETDFDATTKPEPKEEIPGRAKKEKKKKKPKLQTAYTSVDEVYEELAEPFAEPIAEEDQVEKTPIEEVKEIALAEEVQPEEDVLASEQQLTNKEKARKKRTKRLKEVSFEEQPQLIEAEEDSIMEEESTQEISQKTLQLKKREEVRPQYITTEQLIEVDVEEVKRNVDMKISSHIVKKEKSHVVLDTSEPLPELELITQKRVQEVIDKMADEEVIAQGAIKRKEEETTPSEIVEQKHRRVEKKKKDSKPPRITEKLRPRMCVPDQPIVLECKIEGLPFPEIRWYFNDILLFASEKYEMTVTENVAKLKIAKVTPNEVGIYTCEAKNEGGAATSRANVILGKCRFKIFLNPSFGFFDF